MKMNKLPYDLGLCKKLQTEGELEELLGVENLVKCHKDKDDVEFIDEEPDDKEVLISRLQKSVILKAVLLGNVDNIYVIVFECTESYLFNQIAFCLLGKLFAYTNIFW